MPTDGPGFYDQAAVFDTDQAHRATPESPSQTLERTVIRDLMGDVRRCDCLDLGCGDAGQVQQADVATWQGPTEQFDRVSAWRMLHDLPDLAPVLAGVRAALRESEPVRTHFHTDADFERRQRIPLFLFLAARKP